MSSASILIKIPLVVGSMLTSLRSDVGVASSGLRDEIITFPTFWGTEILISALTLGGEYKTNPLFRPELVLVSKQGRSS